MATVEPYETASGKRYRVRYRKPDHTQTSKRGFKTKKEADLYLASVEIGKAEGTYIDPATARATVGALGREWLATQSHLKPSSAAVMESTWRIHVEPVWGRVPIGEIRYSDIQNWVHALSVGGAGDNKPKSPTLVHRAYCIVSAILERSVRDRRISANPARGVHLPRRVGKPHRYLTHEQVHALAAACGQHSTLIRLLAYTGLRWGEATALRSQDISLVRRRITIERNAVLVNGQTVVGTPKTYQRRVVPYPEFLDSALRVAIGTRGSEELVFPNPLGVHLVTPTTRNNSWFDKALTTANLSTMTIHDLRHTAASLAVSAGANVKAVQRMLGHASAAMTLDTYADLFDDDLDMVAHRLSESVRLSDVAKMWPEAVR